MSISAREIAVLVQGLSYLVLTVVTARQFLREPGWLRFHTLVVFASATTALLLTEARLRLLDSDASGAVTSFLLRLSLVSGLLSVYGVFLLTSDLTKFRRWLGWLAIGILALISGFTLLAPGNLTSPTSLVFGLSGPLQLLMILQVFLGSYLFITICFWYRSARSSGAVRRRLQWLGAGSALACCGTAFALAQLLTPGDQLTLVWGERLLLLLSGIALYLGCAPANWLRRLWALPELERASQFGHSLIFRPPEAALKEDAQSQSAAIRQVLQYAMNGLGAFAGTVELWNEQTDALELVASILTAEEEAAMSAKAINDPALLEAFQTREARLQRFPGRRCPFLRRHLDAGATLIAPLVNAEQALGVIGLCCEHSPSFNDSDLARLQLFADQIACLLAYYTHRQQTTVLKTIHNEQTLKDEFIALIAHDLRTPLTVLRGRLQLLRRQLLKEGQADAAELVAKIDTPYNRLSQLITTLLDVSYIDTGRLQLLRHAVDLLGLVRKVVEADSEREIALEVLEPGSAQPMIVLGDASRLEQVLENLLDNARKYSPVGSSITVQVERRQSAGAQEINSGEQTEHQPGQAPEAFSGEEALLSVRDQGIGIPPEDQARLFKRWFRATPTSAQNYAGLGLGLYISHEIITRHGGRLWVESSGIPGEGSTFFFTLPLIPPQQVTEADGSGNGFAL